MGVSADYAWMDAWMDVWMYGWMYQHHQIRTSVSA